MTLVVDVQQVVDEADLPSRGQLIEWARAAWREPTGDAEVVVRITDEQESRQLNNEFRGHDKATNVLSFAYDPQPEVDLRHVGDLVICAPVVRAEAVDQGKRATAHWAHMVVHGMLHLQGFDHENDVDAAAMEQVESEILRTLGFNDPYGDEAR